MTTFFGRIREKNPVTPIKDADRRFIYELVENARAPLAEIAKKLRISKDTAHYTLTKLQKNSVIDHISPLVDLGKLGYRSYHVFFVTNDINQKRKDEFIKYLVDHTHTKSLMEYSARWEVEWVVVARNLQEFDKIITNITTEFSDIVIEKSKLAIIKGYKSTTIAARHTPLTKKVEKYHPDMVDVSILDLLHQDGRMSSYAIAQEVGLSANAVRYRIRKLIKSDIIHFFTATINLNALGYHLYTVGVLLKSLSKDNEIKFKEYIKCHRFITRAVKVLGQWDIMLTILSDNIKNFHKTVKELEDNFSDIIINYDSLISYEEKVFKYLPRVIVDDIKKEGVVTPLDKSYSFGLLNVFR